MAAPASLIPVAITISIFLLVLGVGLKTTVRAMARVLHRLEAEVG